MILYHGSNVRIDRIDLAKCNPYKDFGQAFYLTTDPSQAKDVALARVDIFGGEPVVNAFCAPPRAFMPKAAAMCTPCSAKSLRTL